MRRRTPTGQTTTIKLEWDDGNTLRRDDSTTIWADGWIFKIPSAFCFYFVWIWTAETRRGKGKRIKPMAYGVIWWWHLENLYWRDGQQGKCMWWHILWRLCGMDGFVSVRVCVRRTSITAYPVLQELKIITGILFTPIHPWLFFSGTDPEKLSQDIGTMMCRKVLEHPTICNELSPCWNMLSRHSWALIGFEP